MELLTTKHSNFLGALYHILLIAILTSILCVFLFVLESLAAVLPLRSFASAAPGPKPVAWVRSSLRGAFQARELVDEAYQKYSKNNLPFLFTNIFWRTEVMLPPAQIHLIISPSDSSLSCQKALEDNLQAEWTLLGLLNPHTAINQWHTLPVKALSAAIGKEGNVRKAMEEIELGLDTYWGTEPGEEWKKVEVLETMLKVATRVGNRFIFGTELCRHEEFITATSKFTKQALMGAILIRVFPKLLRPIFGRLIAHPNLKNFHVFERFAKPLVEQKIDEVRNTTEFAVKRTQLPKTNDILQWHVEYARTQPDPEEFTIGRISRRLMVFNTAAVVSTAAALAHMITDLYTMPGIDEVSEELRQEIRSVLVEEGGWTMRALSKMTKLDSAVKESMRLSSNGTGICARVVLPKNGIKLENGLSLPRGATVSVPQWALHHDPDLYPDPGTYHPFRFYYRRKALPGGLMGEQDTESLVAATADNLTWGLGRHACPGRFFVGAEMKLILAHLLLYFDIEPLTKNQTQRWFGTVYVPSDAPFKVRRRTSPIKPIL